MVDQDILNNYGAHILDAKYAQAKTNKVAANQKQVTINQYHNIQNVLTKSFGL